MGGNFTTATNSNGTAVTVNGLARWNGVSWSALGLGVDGTVRALAVSGGDLYVGGYFTTAGGISAANIAKWDGSGWSALGSGMTGGPVSALAFSGSELWAAANSVFDDAVPLTNYITKWDGNSWSEVGQGLGDFGNRAYSLAISDGTVYAGGGFLSDQSFKSGYVAKWDGSNWSAVGSGMNREVLALAASGTNTYAAGRFRSAKNSAGKFVATQYIAQSSGTNWIVPGFPQEGTKFIPSSVSVLANELYAVGVVKTSGVNSAETFVAKWNGGDWLLLGSGLSGSVSALAVMGQDLYAAGTFTMAGGNPATHIAKWDGSVWSPLGSGVGDSIFPYVNTLAVVGTNIYAGGLFYTAGGVPASCIAKWDGSSWSALGSGMGGGSGSYGPQVEALAVLGNDLYAGGFFTTAGAVTVNRVAKWNGSSWSALGSGVNAAASGTGPDVGTLAVMGTSLYVGGSFTAAGGNSTIKYIARWNGSTWSALGSGMAGRPETYWFVTGLALHGNDLYASGAFTIAGGKVAAGVARARISFTPDKLALEVPLGGIPGAQTNTLTFAGVPNYPYLVQYATNLTDSPWFTLSTNPAAANGVGTAIDPAATDPQRFYRVGYQE